VFHAISGLANALVQKIATELTMKISDLKDAGDIVLALMKLTVSPSYGLILLFDS
jgi:hypothetical protein